jgi:TonB family protein
MIRYLVPFVAVLAGAARAQDSTLASPAGQQTTSQQQNPIVPPKPLDRDKSCRLSTPTRIYPQPTEVRFTIATDGSVKNIVVVKSSGIPSVDERAAECAATWHYQPATQNGVPVEFNWIVGIPWALR